MSATIMEVRTLRAYTDGLGRLSVALDTDAPTMEEHLRLHPEDALCPECNAEDWLGGAACPRCWGDLRRGFDCPDCGGRGCGFDAPGCRCGRYVLEVSPDGR